MSMKRLAALVLLLLSFSLVSCRSTPEESAQGGRPTELQEGQLAPEFAVKDLSGAVRKLSEFRGKLVLVNFWATWCAPCVREMPSLERLHQKFRTSNFEVVAISVDIGDAARGLPKFIEQYGLSFPVFNDPEFTAPQLYGVSGFPESFFVGPDGKLLAFRDPSAKGEKRVRIISDRGWDSESYTAEVSGMLTALGLRNESPAQ